MIGVGSVDPERLGRRAVNEGEVSYDRLIAGEPQTLSRNPVGAFRLLQIGDAVAARNTHAAIYDGLRSAKDT